MSVFIRLFYGFHLLFILTHKSIGTKVEMDICISYSSSNKFYLFLQLLNISFYSHLYNDKSNML